MPATPDDILQPGATAPDFTLDATPDQKLSLHELRGKPVVLVFYPADWSSVCGDELSVFNAAGHLFERYGVVVLGISVDSAWSHAAYREAHKITFDLLADYNPKGAVAASYGAYDEADGYCKRALFLIDADGTIAWSYLSPTAINPGVDGVLDALDRLTSSSKQS